MKLLDPKEAKEVKDKSEEEKIQRLRKLSEEECRLVTSINNLNEEEKKIKQRLEIETHKTNEKLKIRKSILSVEVEALEKRKDEAMKPVKEIRIESEKIKNEYETELKELLERKAKIAKDEDDLIEKFEKINDTEDEYRNKFLNLEKREAGIQSAEEEIKRSTLNLSKEWVKFHEESHKIREYIENQRILIENDRKINENDKKINESVRLSNEAEAKRLRNEDRAIKDKYVALEQAKKHLGIK